MLAPGRSVAGLQTFCNVLGAPEFTSVLPLRANRAGLAEPQHLEAVRWRDRGERLAWAAIRRQGYRIYPTVSMSKGDGGDNHVHFHHNVQAMDSVGFGEMLERHSRAVATHVTRVMRKENM